MTNRASSLLISSERDFTRRILAFGVVGIREINPGITQWLISKICLLQMANSIAELKFSEKKRKYNVRFAYIGYCCALYYSLLTDRSMKALKIPMEIIKCSITKLKISFGSASMSNILI